MDGIEPKGSTFMTVYVHPISMGISFALESRTKGVLTLSSCSLELISSCLPCRECVGK
jgi:hypothetical protein